MSYYGPEAVRCTEKELQRLLYVFGEGYEFLSSIPNGAVVSDAVYFDVPMGFMNAEPEYEGKKIDFRNKTLIYDKGYYILKLSAPTASGEPLVGVFTFRISGAPRLHFVTSRSQCGRTA